MEPRDRAAQAMSDAPPTRAARRPLSALALPAASPAAVVLMALAFSQRPGQMVADTKLDLVVDPAGFLARALHLWDPQGGVRPGAEPGLRLPLPDGAVLLARRPASGCPAWVVQRLWWALLLVRGVPRRRAAGRRAGPRHADAPGWWPASRSRSTPRILTLLGPDLGRGLADGARAVGAGAAGPRLRSGARRAARPRCRALAVAAVRRRQRGRDVSRCCRCGVIWLLTRARGPRRRRLLVWWPLFVAARRPLWWLVPLLLLGRYSPPFLDYIETAAITTFPTTLSTRCAARRTGCPTSTPTWPAGNDLLTTGYVVLDSGVLLVLGLVGTALREQPAPPFLALGLLAGLLLVTAGHAGAVPGWFAGAEREAARRGPRAVAQRAQVRPGHAAAAGARAGARARRGRSGPRARRRPRWPRAARATRSDVPAGRHVVLVAGVRRRGRRGHARRWPGGWRPPSDFEQSPATGSGGGWLDEQQAGDATRAARARVQLRRLRPGAARDDEPLQPLGALAVGGAQRHPARAAGQHPDARRDRGAAGHRAAGRPGWPFLAPRRHRPPGGAQRPAADRRRTPAGAGAPGARRVSRASSGSQASARGRGTGPHWGGARHHARRDGWVHRYPAVEIYEVDGADRAVAASSSPLVVGGPENLLDLLDDGTDR